MNSFPPSPPTLDKPAPPDKRAGPRWWAVALFAAILGAAIWLSLRPQPLLPSSNGLDKVQHLVAYAGLTAVAHLACRGRSWLAALGIVVLGVGLEFAQAAEALGREGSALDALANTAGVVLVTLVWPRK